MNHSTKPIAELLAEMEMPPEQFQAWLASPVGRKAMRRLRRTLATFREIDLARGGAGGAQRLLAAVGGKKTMSAQARAVAVALVNLARTRRQSAKPVAGGASTAAGISVDAGLLDELRDAQASGDADPVD